MHDEMGFETVLTAYGLTECCGVVTMCRQGDSAETIANTSGRAIPGVEVEVQDEEGNEVPRGDAGEIMVRGYNVMQGYFNDEEKTAETITDEGWLHTGDIGVMDDDGNVNITDRKKDMYIVGGFNAYPAEIENLILENEDIVHVAVIGVPDERLGEVGAAYLVLREGAELTSEDVISWCRANMANFKVPREVHFVDELPRNATGKVLKYELREEHGGE
jgi:acyl-CoA synthetase (AMP-forming)/AMP-acid ligase II